MHFFRSIQLLPAGSFEYHGEYLPPTTDTVIATRVAEGVAGAIKHATTDGPVVLPALPYGDSSEHRGLPSTVSVPHVAYFSYLQQLLRSIASDHSLIVIVNGHGGNASALSAVEGDFNYSHPKAKVFCPHLYPGKVKDLCQDLLGEFDAHAGSVETSLMAYYLNRPTQEHIIDPPAQVRGALRFFRTIEVAPNGILKRLPKIIADPLLGKRIHEKIVEEMASSILRLDEELSVILNAGGQ